MSESTVAHPNAEAKPGLVLDPDEAEVEVGAAAGIGTGTGTAAAAVAAVVVVVVAEVEAEEAEKAVKAVELEETTKRAVEEVDGGVVGAETVAVVGVPETDITDLDGVGDRGAGTSPVVEIMVSVHRVNTVAAAIHQTHWIAIQTAAVPAVPVAVKVGAPVLAPTVVNARARDHSRRLWRL